VTVAGTVGIISTAASLPECSVQGFSQMARGIQERNASCFFDGLYKLFTVYHSGMDFVNDFNSYINNLDIPMDEKAWIKSNVKEMSQVLVDKIEGKAYVMLYEFEEKLKKQSLSKDQYNSIIDGIYYRHTYDMSDDYFVVLGRAGRIYADICQYNQEHHLVPENMYDHALVFCIAGWLLNNMSKLDCLLGVSQERLAHDITENIFAYLRAIGASQTS